MRQALHLILFIVVAAIVGCTGKNAQESKGNGREPLPSDTVYTQQAAMAVYGYQPERALQIIDSAVIVGNLSEVRADVERARIYSKTQMKARMDSLLGGPKGTSLDSGRVIGERVLGHDSLKQDLNLRQQLLEVLVYTARMQKDTLKWMQWSRELIDVCRREGAETEALRTEAELGAAMCYSGQMKQGMTMLDSVIESLTPGPSPKGEGSIYYQGGKLSAGVTTPLALWRGAGGEAPFRFNELDAFIIASKRKIGVLSSTGRYVETLPLARRIIERLEDYEAHPDQYADDSKRVPADSASRASYINFYRTQAQGYISAAYTALGQYSSMTEAYLQIERSVTAATAREHIARYNALEQRMQRQEAEARAEREQVRADNIRLQAIGIFILLLLAIGFAIVIYRKNRDIRQNNRVLAQQLVEFYDNQTLPHPLPVREGSIYPNRGEATEEPFDGGNATAEVTTPLPDREGSGEGLLYNHIRDEVTRLQLYTDPGFGRQSIIERFHLTKDVASRVFSHGSEHGNISSFITDCRLDHARRLLVSRPDMSIGDIAAAAGFGLRTTFTRSFKAKYGITPTEFREQQM